jgi:hypothetical protein
VVASSDARFQNSLTTRYRLYTVDNDRAGLVVTALNDARTSESGGAAAFDVKLAAKPTADVKVKLVSSNEKEGTVFPSSLAFTADDWSQPQRVLVKGADDGVVDGDVAYNLAFAVASDDLEYAALHPAPVALTNADDEVQAPVVDAAPQGLVVQGQAAGTDNELWVRLKAKPTRPVLVSTAVDGASVRLEPASLGFTPETWSTPQKVRVLPSSAAPVADLPFTVRLSLVSEAGEGAEVPGTVRRATGS